MTVTHFLPVQIFQRMTEIILGIDEGSNTVRIHYVHFKVYNMLHAESFAVFIICMFLDLLVGKAMKMACKKNLHSRAQTKCKAHF